MSHTPTGPLDFEDRVAFVTGTSRGIGKALALALADHGVRVVSTGKTVDGHDRLPGTIVETTEEIRERGGESIYVELDVRDEESVQSAVDRTVDEWGRLDFVVNNAGAIHFGNVADTPPKRFDLLMGVNARGAYTTTHAALPHLLDGDGGHVLNMSPPQSIDAAPGKAPYALSKLGMTFLAKSLAGELAGQGVAANALWPVAAIETEATRHFELGQPEDWRTPEIVADATLEVLSRDPDEFTGHALYDEDVLREAGAETFDDYAVVEGEEPGPSSARLFDPEYESNNR
ncbi:SDR family oxidoreductase [Halobium salinum]|uniref:SDR family oxidoreductase n=1 Tax=Halobium salinum TaxID=1364940 RepID=A0ABD5P7G4_9EURY|nr:SDR family oxidoreductase [Halobium salinum]